MRVPLLTDRFHLYHFLIEEQECAGLRPGSKLGPQGAPATTPTYTSWLNQVERRFGIITRMASRRGSFSSFREPASRIEPFVEHCSAKATPFRWTATATRKSPTTLRRYLGDATVGGHARYP